jgi:hypothetical protein
MKRTKWILSIMLILSLVIMWDPGFAQSISGRTSRGLPQPAPDTNSTSIRAGRYGEVMTVPLYGNKHALADEGSYYIATNPTIGTPIAQTTSITAYADTAGAIGNYFFWKNTDLTGGKRVYLDYIKLMVVQVPTAATSWQWALVTDYGAARYTSGGSAIVPVSPNGDIGTPSVVQMYAGALTTAVGISKRTVGRGTFRGVIPTTFDTYVIVCGATQGGTGFASAAASGRSVGIAPPIILGQGQNLTFIMWGASNAAAASFEFEVGWWEK